MPEKLKPVTSVDEFRRLYYPEADPTLDYFDGVGPDGNQERETDAGDAAVDPLDHFGRALKAGD